MKQPLPRRAVQDLRDLVVGVRYAITVARALLSDVLCKGIVANRGRAVGELEGTAH